MLGDDDGARNLALLQRERGLEIVHHMDARGVWATRGRDVCFLASGSRAWQRIARFPASPLLDAARLVRPSARLLRADRSTVFPTARGGLLGIRAGSVYRLGSEPPTLLGRIQGDCLMNRAIAESADGTLYFGEYFTNAERAPVRIWRVAADLGAMDVAYEIAAGRTRHVHAVHCDASAAGRLWITMGDFAGECFLATSDDGLRSLDWIGDGGQTFRCVGLHFATDFVSWLTDSHLSPNRVVTLDRRSERVELHQQVASSSWYLAQTTDGACLATTTVEPGPAVLTRRAFLLHSRDGVVFREVASFAKDALPMRFFKFGSLALPSGRFSARDFWLSGEGLVGFDGASIRGCVEDA